MRDVINHLSQTVERTRWYELPVAGSLTTTNLIREHLLKMDGLQSWTIERGLTRSRQTSFNPATQTRTETVTAPDNSYRIDVFVAGRATSSTEFSSSGSQVSRVTYAYDPHGRVFSATDARQGTTIVGYNAADLVATHMEPSAGTGAGSPVTSITYDNALRPVQLVRPDGTVVTNEYYASGLLRRLTGSQVLPTEFEYDVQGRQTALISWQSFTAGTGKAANRWEFDAERGWLTARRYPDGTAVLGQQFSYGYDDSGNRTSDGRGGDALGQLRLTTYVNNVFDQPTSVANHRHSEVQGAAQATAAVTVNGTNAERQGEYFRRELTAPGIQSAWQNVDVTVSGGTSISGRKTYVPPQAEAIAHDNDGNLTADGRWEFGWDGENRLVDVRTRAQAYTNGVPRQRVRFDYDASGRVLERREFLWEAGEWTNNLTTRYLYDGWQCIAEFSGSGATRRTHVWGLDLSESRRGAGGLGGLLWLNTATNGTHVAAYDGNGSVLGLIGTTGQVTARYEYGPFGELLRMSGDALAADNPWRWGTKRVDPTTDLVHYEYRVYSPRLGRWLSRDPIGEAGGRNLYAFAGNDPVNSQDVLGLFSWFGGSEPQLGSPGGNMGPSDGGRMESLMRSFVKCAFSAVDGFFPREFSIPMPIPMPTRAARVRRAGSSFAEGVSVRRFRRMGTVSFCDVLRFLRPFSCD